jgi:poly(A) polymerase
VATVGARLKLSKLQRRRLESASEPVDEAPRAMAYRIGMESAIDRLLLTGDSLADLDNWTPPTLPLSGGALVANGLTAGPDVARTLHRVEDRWVAEGFPDAARVAVIADDEVAQLLADIRKS